MRPWKDPEVLPRVCRANNGAQSRIYELALRKTLGAQAKAAGPHRCARDAEKALSVAL